MQKWEKQCVLGLTNVSFHFPSPALVPHTEFRPIKWIIEIIKPQNCIAYKISFLGLNIVEECHFADQKEALASM